jgi:hypothetical protein
LCGVEEAPAYARAGCFVPEDFRTFHGSERPSTDFQYLHLVDGDVWPKPRSNWVPAGPPKAAESANVRQAFLVPVTILERLTKPPQGVAFRRPMRSTLIYSCRAQGGRPGLHAALGVGGGADSKAQEVPP